MGTYQKLIFFVLFFVIEMAMLCLCANSNHGCIEQERQALLRFKESVIEYPQDTLSSWKGTNCCQWNGVWCDAVNGHVVKLDLRFDLDIPINSYSDSRLALIPLFIRSMPFILAREVSPSLEELEYLNYLDLSGIYFDESHIPAFFGSMKHLRYLNLANAGFYGKVPRELGNLTKLQVLDIGNLGLYIDDFSWATRLSSLQHLDLTDVDLAKTHNLVKVLNMLPSLSKLILTDCRLSNTDFEIPDTFPNMTVLRILDLSRNNLTSIPSLFFKLKSLVHLNLARTSINGFPDAIQNMTFLKFLDLSSNGINSVPLWLGKLSKLVHLDLGENSLDLVPDVLHKMTSIRFLELVGNELNSVPLWIGNLKGLLHLNLGSNKLQGPFPNAFQNLTSIRSLIVYDNNIASSIPKWLGNLKKLIHLDLTENKFTEIEGTLSTILTNSCELKILGLSNNNLQGEAFGGDGNFSRCRTYGLEQLDLAHNHFIGRLPAWLAHLKNLECLTVNSNLFTGCFPSSLGELLNLKFLDLSNNHFNGVIPYSLGHLVNLQVLLLSQNHFQGVIPPSLAQLVNLSALDLSSNALEGVISKIVAMFQRVINLGYLNLSNNQINGVFPKNIADMMPKIEVLLLARNFINGSIPHSFCTWELLCLDISQNLLLGTIPDCWKDMYQFSINLSSNKLSGNIPSSLGNILSLIMLHLNNNSLHGEIPISLKNCTNLIVLDLGENQLSEVIPSWIGRKFSSLQIFIIQKNKFFGRIPSSLCQLANLQVLNLASNRLNGPIPHCLGNLEGMIGEQSINNTLFWEVEEAKEILKGIELDYTKNLRFLVNMDLSSNNLVGSIPNNLVVLSRLIGLNLSHNHLTGVIPNNIGDMKSLESLDFSCNQLSRKIPKSMSTLTLLSHLNLSYNNFSGMILKENQFLTFNDPSSYAGNPFLCGAPLPNECSTGLKALKSNNYEDQDRDDKEDKYEKLLFYSVIAIGFTIGFWGFIGPLLLKKSWRHSYFQVVENISDKMYVAAVLKAAKLKRWMQRNHADE